MIADDIVFVSLLYRRTS